MEEVSSGKHENYNLDSCSGDSNEYKQLSSNETKDKEIPIERTELRRNLSLFNVVALMVSITGHVAIFMTPGSIMALSGSVFMTTVVWFVGGFFVYSLALCFAELGTVFQKAGGPYLYISLTFGPLPGFLIAWGYIIMISGPFMSWASYTTAVYIVGAVANDNRCVNDSYDCASLILAGLLIVLLSYLNCRYLQFVLRVQNALTITKMVLIASIILAGLYSSITGSTESFEEPMRGSTSDPGRIALAILIVTFSNGGW